MAALPLGTTATAPPPPTSRRPATTAVLWVLAVVLVLVAGQFVLTALIGVTGAVFAEDLPEGGTTDLLALGVVALGLAAVAGAAGGWLMRCLVRHRPVLPRRRGAVTVPPAGSSPAAAATAVQVPTTPVPTTPAPTTPAPTTPAPTTPAPTMPAPTTPAPPPVDSRPTAALVLAIIGLCTFWTCIPFWIPALVVGTLARTAADRAGDGRAATRATLAIALAITSLVGTLAYLGLWAWIASQPGFEI